MTCTHTHTEALLRSQIQTKHTHKSYLHNEMHAYTHGSTSAQLETHKTYTNHTFTITCHMHKRKYLCVVTHKTYTKHTHKTYTNHTFTITCHICTKGSAYTYLDTDKTYTQSIPVTKMCHMQSFPQLNVTQSQPENTYACVYMQAYVSLSRQGG